ncbi:MAG: glycosyltransferase [Steroidobacteraceae bacterium]
MMKRSVNIIGWDNGGGLSRDIALLRQVLEAEGCRVFLNRAYRGAAPLRWFSRAVRRLYASRFGAVAVGWAGFRSPYELNIHLEEPQAGYFWLAERNVLIPNQEMFTPRSIPHLAGVTEVWVKTRVAEQLFARLGCQVRFLGWSSEDRLAHGSADPKANLGLHVAGSSTGKGTDAVLDVWERNPGWPTLRVLRRPQNYLGRTVRWRERESTPNIEIITDRVEEGVLRRLQNTSAIYLCPSEAEGFGHIILEGLSVGSVVITTDAPPMNELVTADAGLLVQVERSEPMGIGERYFVNHDDLERKIGRALSMSQDEREAFGRAARSRFEAIDQAFRVRIKECVNAILQGPPEESVHASIARSEP